MRRKFILLLILTLIVNASAVSQNRINVSRLIELYGQGARIYFLSASRPSYSVSAYTISKNEFQITTGFSAGEDFLEIPLELSYGVSNRLELFGSFNTYSETLDITGNKISGIGDCSLGLRYKFHESDYFSHAFQTAIKIPSASKSSGLGTGRVDFHFGAGHSYASNIWGYDITAELNLLHRRDLPNLGQRLPEPVRIAIDSIKRTYNYTWEPEICFSLGPALYPSSRIFMYSGFAFSRNTRLNYNYTSIYGGAGYMPKKWITLSAGTSYGIGESTFLFSFMAAVTLFGKNY